MKPFVKSIMFTGILAMAASSVAVAQTSSNSFEQWHRAKYGRPSPTEQARVAANEANTAYRAETPGQVAELTNTWYEGWYRATFGRPSPSEEARIQAEQSNTAYREEAPVQVGAPANTWFEGWYRAKYGRQSPSEEMSLKNRALRSLKLPPQLVKLIAADGMNQQTAPGFIPAGASAIGTLTPTSSAIAIAHDTVSARNYTEPAQPPTYSKAQVRQMMRDAHTREQYLALAEYYRGQQQAFRELERREWSEAVRLSQFSSAAAGRYPRPVDWSMIRYEYFSHKSRQMSQKSAYWEKLSASASQWGNP